MNFQVATIDDVFRNWHFLVEHGVEIEMGPGRHPQSTAVFLYFLGPEGFTYEYSFGVRRIEDDAAWLPRTFDPDEPGSIDMWLGPAPARHPAQPPARASRREATGTAPDPSHRKDRMTATTLPAGQLDVAGVPTAVIDTGDPAGPGRPAGAAGAAAARVGPGRHRRRELAPGDPGAERGTAG